ncbi:alkylglycerol monooxygenase-like [Parasteatoda tepidariorum]|uniref:alkylglycerol monooxygenase-like n=1 Tax=Parasteatoda tepidariorum TaxID=114398 RepID=UPI00077FAA2A|nr:alkylglycerol monooxygenase-like [Parasteatoda tepidariorum]
MEFLAGSLERAGYLFYLVDPRKHNYEKIEDVKDYYKEVAPVFFVTVLLEQVIRYLQKKPLLRVNETMSNVLHGLLTDLAKIPFRGVEVFVYTWIYKNYRLIEFPWNSPWTWLLTYLFTEFCFYWMHRLTHHVNILWAIHETHHSPEDMMLSSPLKNHILLIPTHWFTYLPLALAIPPTTYFVHYQLTIIYQFWIHTEVVAKLPAPIEFFLNTPSHHRAHHGRNRRYIDKNFGGSLIIWDRIFGTFEAEDSIEKPLYGCTTQMKSFNPLIVQTRQFQNIWKRFCEMEKWSDKLSTIFKGPGWSPGMPWTGNLESVPHPTPHFEKYDPQLPKLMKYYSMVHFGVLVNTYLFLAVNMTFFSMTTVNIIAAFISYSCISLGFILDNSKYGKILDFLRCFMFFLVDRIIYQEFKTFGFAMLHLYCSRIIFNLSIAMWISLYLVDCLRKVYKEILLKKKSILLQVQL